MAGLAGPGEWETRIGRGDQIWTDTTSGTLPFRCCGAPKERRFFLVKGVATHWADSRQTVRKWT